MTLNLFVNVYMNIDFLLLSNCFKPIFSLPVEVRHGKRKMIQKRERPLPAFDAFSVMYVLAFL